MKIVIINSVCGFGSTGKICIDLVKRLEALGNEVKIAYGRGEVPEAYRKYAIHIGNSIDVYMHVMQTRLFDRHGYGSKKATQKFLSWLDRYNPDMIWLHNIHGYYINYEMLFNWMKRREGLKVKWTLHDCWSFTGHCSHFVAVKCEQWKEHCLHCVQIRCYPSSLLFDNCKNNYDRKKKAFSGVNNMTLITPSNWLKEMVKQSYLKEYPVEVHYNTIDTDVFRPTPSDFREKYKIGDRKMILGVANVWNDRKGLHDFIKLAQMLDDRYVIVLVGMSRQQIKTLPKQIVGLKRTNSLQELAAIYTAADIFVNPSREETFGMTTVEAQHCGTNAIVYKDTACEEIVREYGGVAVPQGVEYLYKEITGVVWGGKKQGCTIICFPKTNSSKELAAIYTAADFFVNPTYEDTYPTVNLEAISCGTYVLTYNVGGTVETLKRIVEKRDLIDI